MSNRLHTAWAKIERANESIKNLQSEILTFIAEMETTVSVKPGIAQGEQIISALGKKPPLRFSVIAGEIIHHLRSSLDHVAHQLVLVNGKMTSKRTEVPIFVNRDEYIARHEPEVEGISDAAKTFIESLQPFQQGHVAALDHPLWLVHDSDIPDKHKLLVVVVTRGALEHMTFNDNPDNVRLFSLSPGALSSQAETEVARFHAPPSMQVKPHISRDVVFDQIGTTKHESVVSRLQQLSDFVGNTINSFIPFFP